jgi:hypothetical protein
MTKREKMRHSAEALARKALGPKANEEMLKAVADKIFSALPRQVREAA